MRLAVKRAADFLADRQTMMFALRAQRDRFFSAPFACPEPGRRANSARVSSLLSPQSTVNSPQEF
jgi:hypothetical protein